MRTIKIALVIITIPLVYEARSAWSTNNRGKLLKTAATKQKQRRDDEHFVLCNRKFYVKDLPPIPNGTEFGISTSWKRNLSNAILLHPKAGENGSKLYGQTGNQIAEFFHAFDMAFDRNAAILISEEGFPLDIPLGNLFPGIKNNMAYDNDAALVIHESGKELGLVIKSVGDWKANFERMFGVQIFDSSIDPMQQEDFTTIKKVKTKWLYWYKSTNHTLEQRKAHRHYVIQKLYQITAEEMAMNPNSAAVDHLCSAIYAAFGNVGNKTIMSPFNKTITKKYAVIHSRAMPEFYLQKVQKKSGVDKRAATDFPPELIASILVQTGMLNPLKLETTNSILMITDGENADVIAKLSRDSLIGPNFQVVRHSIGNQYSDMMLAILSDVFIGNPASSFSWFIAQARYALGIEHSYLFFRRNAKSSNGWGWETFCDEDCLYDHNNFHWG